MDNGLRIEQQSKLQQRLNPRQVILGRYLEMTAPELEDEVRRELEENPALVASHETQPDGGSLSEQDESPSDTFNESAEQLQRADYGDEDDIPFYQPGMSGQSYTAGREWLSDTDAASLYDVLVAQLADLNLDATRRRIAEYIIGNLDDNGYITRSLTDIADDMAIAEGIDVDIDTVRDVYEAVRRLDPAGVGAVDLRDCLLLQIDRYPSSLTVKIARETVADCFDLFSKKHYDQIRSRLGVDADAFADALDFIRTLHPKPGTLVEGTALTDRLRHIIPDFAVDIDTDGNATVSLLNNVPELAIEESFRLDDSLPRPRNKREADATAFIKRRRDDAEAFMEMLDMRARTLMAVMRAIVSVQHRFFETDDRATIRPMIIKDISELTGLDISVISRAAANKYVLTAHGVYPLKMFFNERPKDDGDASSHEILETLSEIIASEDKSHPLSDEALKSLLDERGYGIARRTVTKYREKLGLPVARLRKQYKIP